MPKFLQSRHVALLVSVAVLAAVVWAASRNLDGRELLKLWTQSNPAWLLVAAAITGLVVLSGVVRGRHVAEAVIGQRVGFWPMTRVNWITLFLGVGAPVSAMADVARIGLVKVILKCRVGEAVQVALYDRILGVLGMAIVGACLIPVQLLLDVSQPLVAAQAMLWLAGLGGVAGFAIMGRIPLPKHWDERVQKLADVVRKFMPLLMKPSFAVQQFAIAWLYILTSAASLWAVGKAMGLPLDLVTVALFTPAIMLVSSLPIFYAGWGGREAAVMATLGSMSGMTGAEAVGLSIAYGVVTMLVSLAGGLIWLAQPLPPLAEAVEQPTPGNEARQAVH